ncbi:DUF4157 domain-containing protein [Planctomycetota bacterium]
MKQAHSTGKAATQTRSISQSDSSAGQNAVAIAPPDYGLDFVDSDQAAAMPLQRSSGLLIQAKLKIGQPGDKYEQEADRMADQVVRMPESQCPMCEEEEGKKLIQSKTIAGHITPLIQRQVEEEEEEFLQTKSLAGQIIPLIQRQVEEEEEEEFLQARQTSSTTPKVSPDFTSRIQTMKGSGQPLTDSTRSYFEPRFGRDFGRVRLHTDSRSAETAQEINARAFTTGRDVAFGRGQYSPETTTGKKLLAHELTHTIQQGASSKTIQADFAVRPTTPHRGGRTLTATQIQAAITFNQARITDPAEIGLMRDIMGIRSTPQVIDADFVNAVVTYQSQFGLARNGRIGHDTADRLAREIIAEADFLGPGKLGSLAPEFNLQTAIQTLITANNRTYADYQAAIQGSTLIQQHVALRNRQLLIDLRGQLSWNNWARCIELLGRRAPTGNRMHRNATVLAEINAAWAASTPGVTRWNVPGAGDPALAASCDPIPAAPAPAVHEEGGWIYMNLLTGALTTQRAAAGGQAGINLNVGAPLVANSVMVGTFHTHPNVGACWGAVVASGNDIANANARGIPNLIRGAFPAVGNIANIVAGPTRRNHLAGNRLAPGAASGLAPQADILGRESLE